MYMVLAACVSAVVVFYFPTSSRTRKTVVGSSTPPCFFVSLPPNKTIPSLPPPALPISALVFHPLHRIHQQDPRQLLGPSSGKRIFKGSIVGACPTNVATKIRERATWPPVGTHLLMMGTRDVKGGLYGALERANGLSDLKTLYEASGAEVTIALDQIGGSAEVLEAIVGECNNGSRNFHEDGADVHTAKVIRALRAAVPLTSAARPLIGKNSNNGGCEQTINATGSHNCRLNKEYPDDQREAARQIENALYEKVSKDFPDARILVVHRFGDYAARRHKQDDKPLVTKEVVRGGLVVLSVRSIHACQIPGSPLSLLSNVEARLALNEHAARELGRRQDYTDGDVGKGILDVLEILATGEQESAEYRARLGLEKTSELVAMVDNLRLKPLEVIMSGAKEFGERYGGRGYTAESGKRDLLPIGICR